ncbi:hypothetical protein SALWKB29_1108 [Snodgrassella communis]|uniref:Uncharacterized protein n=1 Tax=Snodgrassella communis TaxID=2946699 RepID=A0A836MQ25_9NEIS|nr:hypothetical protein SALWKB29_1108 [Snodgrassella communis]
MRAANANGKAAHIAAAKSNLFMLYLFNYQQYSGRQVCFSL